MLEHDVDWLVRRRCQCARLLSSIEVLCSGQIQCTYIYFLTIFHFLVSMFLFFGIGPDAVLVCHIQRWYSPTRNQLDTRFEIFLVTISNGAECETLSLSAVEDRFRGGGGEDSTTIQDGVRHPSERSVAVEEERISLSSAESRWRTSTSGGGREKRTRASKTLTFNISGSRRTNLWSSISN